MCSKSISLTITSLLLSSSINAATLTFDDISGGSIQNDNGSMPIYQGFNFSTNLGWIDVVDSSWNYGAKSGDFALLNNFASVGVITEENNADFTFDGLWVKKWNTPTQSGGADSLFGNISGYNNGSLIWQVDTSLNGSYEFYAAQSGAIDELHLGFGDFFLVDDLSLTAAVPVPAAAWLFTSGLIALAGLSRRKSHI